MGEINLWKTCGKLVEKMGEFMEKSVKKLPYFSTEFFNKFFHIKFNAFSTKFSIPESLIK